MKTKLESDFQSSLKSQIKELFPGCIIKRNSTDDIQGFPDLTVYFKDKYAMLECKRSAGSPHRPNQDYYIRRFKEMGVYATFVYPENKQKVIGELWGYFNDQNSRGDIFVNKSDGGTIFL